MNNMETKDAFDEMASRYDTEDRDRIAGIIAGAIRGELTETRGKKALDYGCGTGLVGLKLLNLFGSVLFVDTSSQMIGQVQKKIEKSQAVNAFTLCADFCQEVPSALNADYIIASQVLLHVKDYPLLLSRFYGILNPKGRLIIADFDKNDVIVSDRVHNGFEQTELAQAIINTGFISAKSYTFHHGSKMFMNQDASLFLLNAQK